MKVLLFNILIFCAVLPSAFAQERVSELSNAEYVEEENHKEKATESEEQVLAQWSKIPEKVKKAIKKSHWSREYVEQVKVIRGNAIDQVVTKAPRHRTSELYEVYFVDASRSLLIYITPDGQVYDTIEII